jgi:hypothetical protein
MAKLDNAEYGRRVMATPAQLAAAAKRDAAMAARNPAAVVSKPSATPQVVTQPKKNPKDIKAVTLPMPINQTPGPVVPGPVTPGPVTPPPPKVDTGDGIRIASQYGISEALLNDPIYGAELSAVYALFKAERIGEALEALFRTSYYKNLTGGVAQRRKDKVERPGVYANDLDAYKSTQRRRLVGLKINAPDLDNILQDAYDRGLTDNQIDDLLKFSSKVTGFGGETLGDVNALKSFANAFGVGSLLNQTYWDSKSRSLFSGETTDIDIQEEIKTLAASAFPAYAPGIMKGVSLAVQASNVVTTVANLLERDPDTVTFDDPIVKRIMNWTNPTTGKQEVMPQYLVEKETKSTEDWLFTNNARNSIDSLTSRVFSDMGII